MSNGVVHVGAHISEERSQYEADGRSPIIFFDPQDLGNDVILAALGDYDGITTLRIPKHLHDNTKLDTMSASILPLNKENARSNGWTPTECFNVEVPIMRFDTWARKEGFESASCSLLVIDVQGAELQVLRGMGDFLRGFEELRIECSEPPLYDGGASASEIVSYLLSKGFLSKSPILRHGDINFKKEK